MKKKDRIERLKSEVGGFARQYARKRRRGMDPNDRHYDRKIQKKIRKMKPEDFNELLND
jgi:hypothetical protein